MNQAMQNAQEIERTSQKDFQTGLALSAYDSLTSAEKKSFCIEIFKLKLKIGGLSQKRHASHLKSQTHVEKVLAAHREDPSLKSFRQEFVLSKRQRLDSDDRIAFSSLLHNEQTMSVSNNSTASEANLPDAGFISHTSGVSEQANISPTSEPAQLVSQEEIASSCINGADSSSDQQMLGERLDVTDDNYDDRGYSFGANAESIKLHSMIQEIKDEISPSKAVVYRFFKEAGGITQEIVKAIKKMVSDDDFDGKDFPTIYCYRKIVDEISKVNEIQEKGETFSELAPETIAKFQLQTESVVKMSFLLSKNQKEITCPQDAKRFSHPKYTPTRNFGKQAKKPCKYSLLATRLRCLRLNFLFLISIETALFQLDPHAQSS